MNAGMQARSVLAVELRKKEGIMAEPAREGKAAVSIALAGEAGQGIQTIEYVLTRVMKLAGYHVFACKEYMSRVRGGVNSTEIRIASKRSAVHYHGIDIAVPLSAGAMAHLGDRVHSGTVVIGEKTLVGNVGKGRLIEADFAGIAEKAGNRLYANIGAVGLLSGLFAVEQKLLERFLRVFFAKKSAKIIRGNIAAAGMGYSIGTALRADGTALSIDRSAEVKDDLLLSGAEAVALGAISGGCHCVFFYPMSPSTGVAQFCAQHASEFTLAVEQTEDEIAAINMALGTWYGGGRALVTTSGGGFALMTEGLSLAGMLELPLVVHVGQRPGPATGLPTRTEQGDLALVRYGGHGDFPRVILSPGTIEDAFELARVAFEIADGYQVPVFILTDQYLLDSYYNMSELPFSKEPVKGSIVRTTKQYQRYQITENGVSPRGIPGHGTGFVVADSDEHDVEGHMTESFEVRSEMVEKRLRHLATLREVALAPVLIGKEHYHTLVIGWGSTYWCIKEALDRLDRDDISFLHFSQVYPLHEKAASYLKKARQRIIVESNVTGQLADLLLIETGIDIEHRILKCNGLSFSVEELEREIGDLVGEGA